MAKYGIPFIGSKSSIAHKVCSIFPKADNFYDLFGGGFAITHYMLLHRSKNYSRFFYNNIPASVTKLIKDAIAGKYNYKVFKPPFISREEFFRKKGTCAYTRILWSFGNNQRCYLFGKNIEQHKKSLHNAVIFDEFDNTAIKALGICRWPAGASMKSKRLFIGQQIKRRIGGEPQQLQQLQRIEQLQQLQRLEQLERLERLELTSLDYRDVKILPNSVIYCDPPYDCDASKSAYTISFNHKEFWDWVRNNPTPVFVSEYKAPGDIKTVMAIRKRVLSSPGCADCVENVFVNDAALSMIKSNKEEIYGGR
jgi:site-specific DNA-adenine methylase